MVIIVRKRCRKCGEVQNVKETYPDRRDAGTMMVRTSLQPCLKCGGLSFIQI